MNRSVHFIGFDHTRTYEGVSLLKQRYREQHAILICCNASLNASNSCDNQSGKGVML